MVDNNKFVAFAKARPKLFERESLFGGIDGDHAALKLFFEYVLEEKRRYTGLPTEIGIDGFKAYISSQNKDGKYQYLLEGPKSLDTLFKLGYLKDQLGHRDLYDFAEILIDLKFNPDPRFIENNYNEFIKTAFRSSAPLEAAGNNPTTTPTKTTNQINQTEAPAPVTEGGAPQASEITEPKPEDHSDFYGPSGLSISQNGTESSGGVVLAESQVKPKVILETTLAVAPNESLSQEPLAQEAPQAANEALTEEPLESPITLPNEQLLTEQLPNLAEQIPNLESLAGLENEAEKLSALQSLAGIPQPLPSNSGPVAISGSVSGSVNKPINKQSTQRKFQRIIPGKSTKISFLEQGSNLRKREVVPKKQQIEAPLLPLSSRFLKKQQQPKVTVSKGRKLATRIGGSIAGVATLLASIPSGHATAQVFKKAIVIALFSLVLVVNLPAISSHLAPELNNYTAYAEDAALAAAEVPPPSCGTWTAMADQKSCTKEFPTVEAAKADNADTACPAGYPSKLVEEKKVTCSMAQDSTIADSEQVKNFTEIIVAIQKFLNVIIWPILVMIGGLMDNSLLFGSGMEERLRDIWIPMRNLVNILFVIVLVGIALYNVLGIGEDGGNYSIKSMLPKIIIGIIAVNFSFTAIKVVLDGTNALTTAIFALPSDVNTNLGRILNDSDPVSVGRQERLCAQVQGKTVRQMSETTDAQLEQEYKKKLSYDLANQAIPDKIQANMTPDQILAAVQAEEDRGKANPDKPARITVQKFQDKLKEQDAKKMCNGLKLTDTGKEFLREWNGRSAAMAMAINMGNIVFYEDVKLDVDNIDKLFINTMFSMIMYLIYVASFIALFIVLLARILVMWLCIALSPILILIMAAPELKEKIGGFSKIEEEFTKNAIAPIIIALSMTIGWIMLNALQGLNKVNSATTTSLSMVMPNNGIPISGLNTLEDLIVAIGTIGVVWLGVFSAAEGTIAGDAVGVIKESLQSAGGFLGKLPFKHLPMVPINLPGDADGKYSVSDVLGTVRNLTQQSDSKNALWEKLDGGSGRFTDHKTFTDQSRVKDKDTFYKAFNSATIDKIKDNNSAKIYADELKTLRDKIKPSWWNELDAGMRKKIDKFIESDAPTPAMAREIHNSEDNGKKVSSYGKLEGTKSASAAAAAAAKPAATPPPFATNNDTDTANQNFGGSPIRTQITGASERDAAISTLKDRTTKINTEIQGVADPAKATAEETKSIKDSLNNMRTASLAKGELPYRSELEQMIGKDAMGKMEKALGKSYDTVRNEILGDRAKYPAPPTAAAEEAAKEDENTPL